METRSVRRTRRFFCVVSLVVAWCCATAMAGEGKGPKTLRAGAAKCDVTPPLEEFQLFAQRSAPRQFVAVAGYGDAGTGYLCTRESYAQGGYEPSATLISPDGEAVLKSAVRRLLDADR